MRSPGRPSDARDRPRPEDHFSRNLCELALRDYITAVTNWTESFHNYATWLMIGGRLIDHNDPDYQEKVAKFNEMVGNAAI